MRRCWSDAGSRFHRGSGKQSKATTWDCFPSLCGSRLPSRSGTVSSGTERCARKRRGCLYMESGGDRREMRRGGFIDIKTFCLVHRGGENIHRDPCSEATAGTSLRSATERSAAVHSSHRAWSSERFRAQRRGRKKNWNSGAPGGSAYIYITT